VNAISRASRLNSKSSPELTQPVRRVSRLRIYVVQSLNMRRVGPSETGSTALRTWLSWDPARSGANRLLMLLGVDEGPAHTLDELSAAASASV
jgi:hypothetical protein